METMEDSFVLFPARHNLFLSYSGKTIANNNCTTNTTIDVSDGDIVYTLCGGYILTILYLIVLINYVIFKMYFNKINKKQKKKTFYGFT